MKRYKNQGPVLISVGWMCPVGRVRGKNASEACQRERTAGDGRRGTGHSDVLTINWPHVEITHASSVITRHAFKH